MEMQKLSCSNCGSGSLVKISDETSVFECEYCKTQYIIKTDEEGALKDVKISGNMQHSGTFAVHQQLKISGNMNTVVILRRGSRTATHVSTLKISGNMNSCSVVLLDGATIQNSGNMNTVS